MIIRTKKYRFSEGKYVQLALLQTFRQQWWVLLLLCSLAFPALYTGHWGWPLASGVALALYVLFWWVQFYGLTTLEQNKILFERLSYEISPQQVVIQLTSKQGMAIPWQQIVRARATKEGFLLVVSQAQLIYLPYKIFASNPEVDFVRTLLKRKKLL